MAQQSSAGIDDTRADMDEVSGPAINTQPPRPIPVVSRTAFCDLCRNEGITVPTDVDVMRDICKKTDIDTSFLDDHNAWLQAAATLDLTVTSLSSAST